MVCMARPRNIAGGTPSPDQIVALHEKGRDPDEIAAKLGCSERHVLEVLRVEERGIPELKKLIRKPRTLGGIIPRAAARIAVRSETFQRRLLPKLVGLAFMQANKRIQAAERTLPRNRGRAPTRVALKNDVRKRCDDLMNAIIGRIEKGERDRRLLAHAEVLLIMTGRLKVGDVYLPNGRLSRLLSRNELLRQGRRR